MVAFCSIELPTDSDARTPVPSVGHPFATITILSGALERFSFDRMSYLLFSTPRDA